MLQLFQHQTIIRVLDQFVRFDSLHILSSASVETYVESSIIALVRIDAFIATTVIYPQKDSTDTAGGYRQKLYQETFKPYVANAFNKIIGKVLGFVQD